MPSPNRQTSARQACVRASGVRASPAVEYVLGCRCADCVGASMSLPTRQLVVTAVDPVAFSTRARVPQYYMPILCGDILCSPRRADHIWTPPRLSRRSIHTGQGRKEGTHRGKGMSQTAEFWFVSVTHMAARSHGTLGVLQRCLYFCTSLTVVFLWVC